MNVVTSCSMKRKRLLPIKCARLSGLPVMKLSIPTTEWPLSSKRSQRCEPRNPAAPVTRTLIGNAWERRVPPRAFSCGLRVPQALLVVRAIILAELAALDRTPPCFILAVPAHGCGKPLVERPLRLPPKTLADLARVNRVALHVSRAIAHETHR